MLSNWIFYVILSVFNLTLKMQLKQFNSTNFSVLCLSLIALDQISKYYFLSNFPAQIHLNPGIAFSLPIPIDLTVWISILILSMIMHLLLFKKLEMNFIWILFLAGGIGNLIDRVRIGAVIDFIQIGWFPVFNLADIYITLSAIGIVVFYLFNLEKNGKQSN